MEIKYGTLASNTRCGTLLLKRLQNSSGRGH
jgi:hypothetical protein